MQLYRYFVSQSSEFCRPNPLHLLLFILVSTQSGNFSIHLRIIQHKQLGAAVPHSVQLLGYRLDIRGSIPGKEVSVFSFAIASNPVHSEKGPHSPGLMRLGCESNDSSAASAEVMNAWSYSSIPPCVFISNYQSTYVKLGGGWVGVWVELGLRLRFELSCNCSEFHTDSGLNSTSHCLFDYNGRWNNCRG
jgi:hypothetical protein